MTEVGGQLVQSLLLEVLHHLKHLHRVTSSVNRLLWIHLLLWEGNDGLALSYKVTDV